MQSVMYICIHLHFALDLWNRHTDKADKADVKLPISLSARQTESQNRGFCHYKTKSI